jgi:excisionase family DNA binding protein
MTRVPISERVWASPREFAKLLNCSERTVLRQIENGELKAYRLSPRVIRINLAEVLDG